MDQLYHPLREQVIHLQERFHDTVNDHTNPYVNILNREMQTLRHDIEVQKNPRSLEDRVKIIQHQLLEMKVQGTTALNYDHVDYLHHGYEQVRNNIRQFPHY